jgi:pantetheine-phosphate adenylyltransferase
LTLAVYPGSFDPITKGHVDVLQRAARLFDEVIIAVSLNTSKKSFLPVDVRMELIKQSISDIPNVKVDSFKGLTVEYAKQNGAIALIRGLRAVSDFEYEMQMAQMNKSLYSDLETVFLVPKSKYNFISSSTVKEVAKFGGDIRKFVTEPVYEYLANNKEVIRYDS